MWRDQYKEILNKLKPDIWDKRTQAVGMVLIVALFIIIRNPKLAYRGLFSSHECYNKLYMQQMTINGIVTKKYLDKWNHLNETIEVKEGNDLREIGMSSGHRREIWDKIAVGDALIKKEDELKFFIKRKNTRYIIRVKFACQD